MLDLDTLSDGQLEQMAAAGREVMECHRVLAATEDNIVGELLRTGDGFFEWQHYPQGDVYDHSSHAQFYYHAHAKGARDMEEHGHFHTFLRPKGMPDGVAPAAIPGVELPGGANDALSHLIAVSMDAYGYPTRLFTTNRWVTGEVWYEARDVIAMLDRFVIDHAQPSWPVNRWITGMVRLFRPQIEALIHERDRAVAAWATGHPGGDVYEDRGLEVTSHCDIRVEEQVRQVNEALARRRPQLKILAGL